jgi:radical SAM superfamily enzyme with C-terminal helix-hairpin-helix motif
MGNTITILDGYTDEPSCLGVPPMLAPLPRYIYGAIIAAKTPNDTIINYLTIDEYREALRSSMIAKNTNTKIKLFNKSNLLIIIVGAIVPGKYLQGTPISLREIIEIADDFNGIRILGGAAARFGFSGYRFGKLSAEQVRDQLSKIFDIISTGDLDATVFDYLTGNESKSRNRETNEWNRWAIAGAQLVSQHPDYPIPLQIELEAGSGCVRYFSGGCSFCSEPLTGSPVFRTPEDISKEVKILNKLGVRNFRLGGLSCIFSYFATGIGDSETPTPNPKMVKKLLTGIRKSAPIMDVLHLDNANPAVMAANVSETTAIIKTIIQTCSGGNVLSFGLESADPDVIKANNLNTNVTEVEAMIKLVNKYGAAIGETGLPILLPGLNFVFGLKGESKNTFKFNFEFLKSIMAQDLLLRRINLRQVIPISGSKTESKNLRKNHKEFLRHKKMVREQIDRPMLERVVPHGTILKNVFTEQLNGRITFGRQLGTYPILVGIPYETSLEKFVDVFITEHGYRSITGFTVPFHINTASRHALLSLPAIGAKRAARIIIRRPFNEVHDIHQALDDDSVLIDVEDYLDFETQ